MIDTFMVLWNRDRRRRGLKLFLTFLLIGFSASLLLATLYIPRLISLPNRGNFARDFIIKTTAIATIQSRQPELTPEVSASEKARTIEAEPTRGVEQPCTSLTTANTSQTPLKKHVKHNTAKKTLKKVHQRRSSQHSSHGTSKKTFPLKVVPPPKSTLRPTKSIKGPTLKPTTTSCDVVKATVTVTSTVEARGTVIANTTPTAVVTIETNKKNMQSGGASIPHLQYSGGPTTDDASSASSDDPAYTSIAGDGIGRGRQISVSCLKKRSPPG